MKALKLHVPIFAGKYPQSADRTCHKVDKDCQFEVEVERHYHNSSLELLQTVLARSSASNDEPMTVCIDRCSGSRLF